MEKSDYWMFDPSGVLAVSAKERYKEDLCDLNCDCDKCMTDPPEEVIRLLKESTMNKLYRLKQNMPTLEAGAIVKLTSGAYSPIDTIWDTSVGVLVRKSGNDIRFGDMLVESSPEWFEEIYENTLNGAKYVTKEEAKQLYADAFQPSTATQTK